MQEFYFFIPDLMKKIIIYLPIIIACFSFFSVQFSLADYTVQEKISRLVSEQGQQRIETYCDECPVHTDQELNDYLNNSAIQNLMNQDRSEDDRWLWKQWNDWWSKCNWIKLNTDFPIIWNCITISEWQANPTNVFPWMMRALTRIIMSIILVVCFIMIIIAWIMRAWAWEDSSQKTKAKDIIKKVAIAVLLLWFSWAILRLINPNFFG